MLTNELLDDVGALNVTDAFEFMPNFATNDLSADSVTTSARGFGASPQTMRR